MSEGGHGHIQPTVRPGRSGLHGRGSTPASPGTIWAVADGQDMESCQKTVPMSNLLPTRSVTPHRLLPFFLGTQVIKRRAPDVVHSVWLAYVLDEEVDGSGRSFTFIPPPVLAPWQSKPRFFSNCIDRARRARPGIDASHVLLECSDCGITRIRVRDGPTDSRGSPGGQRHATMSKDRPDVKFITHPFTVLTALARLP
jgi:hypothetical protein